MRSRLVWALVALNALLLATLVGQWLRPTAAVAQVPRASDYLMIPATIQASPTDVVYIIDEANGLLTARFFDGQAFQDMAPPIDLSRLMNPDARRGRGR
jgi:hypothetical protein